MPTSSILGVGGVGGLTFGLAAKDVVANFLGGTMLAILRPFTLGEEIFVTGGQGFRGSGTPSVSGAFYTLVPVRPRRRGERRSLRALPVASLRPPPAFNPRPRRLSTPTDACQLHPDIALYGTTLRLPRERDRVVPDDAHRERHEADLRAERCAANPEPFLFSPTYKTLDPTDDAFVRLTPRLAASSRSAVSTVSTSPSTPFVHRTETET
jgi:hypothetical protein